MKQYEQPYLEITEYDTDDIMTTSSPKLYDGEDGKKDNVVSDIYWE